MTYPEQIESHFCALRGTAGFRLSPKDWNRACGWEKAGIPLERALRGMDKAFQAHAARRKREERVNGLAICERYVKEAAKR